MNRCKAAILDGYASDKILAGPYATARSRAAAAALRADPRYAELRRRLARTGFFAPAPWAGAARMAALTALAAGSYAVLCVPGLGPEHRWLRLAAIAVAGLTMVQCSFLAHEAAHGAISRRPRVAAAIGQLFTTFWVGYAFAYFRRSHDLHHYHVNERAIDPDTQSSLFSVNEHAARTKQGLGRWITRHQTILIPVMSPLWAVGMKWDGLTYLWRNRRAAWLDCVVIALHAVLWLVIPGLAIGWGAALANYFAWTAVAGLYLKIIIPVNHVATTTLGPEHAAGIDFLAQQITTSRNIAGPAILDHLFIGLNLQIEHHLFPFVPTTRLRAGREVVRAFCREHGLPYLEQGYLPALADVYRHFARVARFAGAELTRPEAAARAAAPSAPAASPRS
jgi:fatty acid desaturase